MLYVLVHTETRIVDGTPTPETRVLVGPRDWHPPMFEGALERVGIQFPVPRREPESWPMVIDEDTYITECEMVIPEHNPKIETYYGPFWDFSNPVRVLANHQIKDRDMGSVKDALKAIVAAERYQAEIVGPTMTLQGQEVSLDTTREGRNIFVQKWALMGDQDTVNWKFPETWLILTKSELGQVIGVGAAHIQGAFDWELGKVEDIDAATTLAELDAIDTAWPQPPTP